MLVRLLALAGLLVALAVAAVLTSDSGSADDIPPVVAQPPSASDPPPTLKPPGRTAVPVKRLAAVVERRAVLRRWPNGRRLGTVGTRTRFGSRQQLAVVARRGTWLGVLHPNARRGRAGWIPGDAARVVRVPWEIALDRSAQVVRVRRDGRLLRRFRVAVGRASSPTPLGRYAITDRIRPKGATPYGCCILAISARQQDLPPGWTGGDRVAFHGSATDSVGGAVSAGCVRMKRRALRWLMKRVPNGTRVDVVA